MMHTAVGVEVTQETAGRETSLACCVVHGWTAVVVPYNSRNFARRSFAWVVAAATGGQGLSQR